MTKRCTKCGQELEATTEFFHRDRQKSDGLRVRCKACHCAEEKQTYAVAPERKMEQARDWYAANKDKANEYAAQWSREHRDWCKEYRLRYPDRNAARRAVHKAVKRGKLARADKCEDCGEEVYAHAHHESYAPDKRLDVVWLCRACHGKRHRYPRKEEMQCA
jgi:hypothetical protein